MVERVLFEDLGMRRYKEVWEYQELLLKKNTDIKLAFRYKDGVDIATLPTVHH